MSFGQAEDDVRSGPTETGRTLTGAPKRVEARRRPLPARLYLLGFMGCGKTTVGSILAERLGWHFVDLDDAIESITGLSVQQIFSLHGERWFRSVEHDLLRKTAHERERTIVSLGGGTFVSEVNRSLIWRSGVSIWLDVPFPILGKRVLRGGGRPLAQSADQLYQLYRSRLPFYYEADLRLRVGDASTERISRVILRELRRDWSVLAQRRNLSL